MMKGAYKMEQLNTEKINLGQEKLEKQHYEFRDDMLSQDKQSIYNASFKIAVIEDFVECLNENVGGDERADAVLIAISEEKLSLDALYDEFLKAEHASFTTWEDVLDFFGQTMNHIGG